MRMSIQSDGGTTLPDFGVFLFVVVCGLISVILNPPVLYRHLGAPFTVHRVTSFLIALLNLTSSIIQIYAAFRYILPASENDPSRVLGYTTAVQRTYSVILTSVILIPNLLTAIMLAARYFQLRFPLRIQPKKRFFAVCSFVSFTQILIMICFYCVNLGNIKWSLYNVMAVNWNPFSSSSGSKTGMLGSMLMSLSIPSILQVAGVAFIFLTISHLKKPGGMAASQSGRDTTRITYRILLMNAGSLLHTVSLVFLIAYTFSLWTDITSTGETNRGRPGRGDRDKGDDISRDDVTDGKGDDTSDRGNWKTEGGGKCPPNRGCDRHQPIVKTHMHGRLKVKTTAEKEAERAKEREKKKAIYLGAMAKIRQLYNSGDRSEKLLVLLGQVLERVPEFTTLWNWRRTVFRELLKKRDQVGNKDENKEDKEKDKQLPSSGMKEDGDDSGEHKEDNNAMAEKKEKERVAQLIEEEQKEKEQIEHLIEGEKKFVVRCLEVNPKAYALWLHRRWLVSLDPTVLNRGPTNSIIQYRFVVNLGGISMMEELNTTTALIERNFSNYSAWHYRSTLLDTSSAETVNRELEWTQNAYFTEKYYFSNFPPYLILNRSHSLIQLFYPVLRALFFVLFPLSCHRISRRTGRLSDRPMSNKRVTCHEQLGTRYLGHVTGSKPIRDLYFLIRSVPRSRSKLRFGCERGTNEIYRNILESWDKQFNNFVSQEPTVASKQPIRTRYLVGYQPIRDQYFLIRSVPVVSPIDLVIYFKFCFYTTKTEKRKTHTDTQLHEQTYKHTNKKQTHKNGYQKNKCWTAGVGELRTGFT
eukprot:sb/3462170/